MRGALFDGALPWLHAKPIDAAIGWVPVLYCPGSCYGQHFWKKQKNTTKTQLLPSFLTGDRRKKAKQFQDPKRTLYSRHQCNKLRTNNVKHLYSSWRAQLQFELSNVVNGQKFEKLLTLNEAKKNLWAKYGPIAVKLLRNIYCWIIDALAILRRNTSIHIWCISHVSESKSVPSGSRFKWSGGACLSLPYTSNWLVSKSRHLAILSNSA